jgi:hypothetical protein
MSPEPIARVRISLKHVEPAIWRLVEVPLAPPSPSVAATGSSASRKVA